MTNLIKFYSYVLNNTFLSKGIYDLLMNDIIVYGQYNTSKDQMMTGDLLSNGDQYCYTFVTTKGEKSRISKAIQFQSRFEAVRKELIEG